MKEVKYSYNGRFDGNILVVGRTGCGKTTFVRNLQKKKPFGDIKEVFWITKIVLSAEREDSIRDCFKDQSFNLNYPDNIEDFDYLLETCKRDKEI